MSQLYIEPVWNVAYHFIFNNAIEKFWRFLKAKYRPRLLQKMLEENQTRNPLKEAL